MTIDINKYEKEKKEKEKKSNCYEISRGTFWFIISNSHYYINYKVLSKKRKKKKDKL